ncbi:MAG: hypothetical protein JXR96_05860 [Deltaproteobacteria bacterium]|nr:hypothetical protein [Deltaproteobacteria bacterium]
MAAQEYKFKFTVFTVTATLDDVQLTVKQGPRRMKADLATLRYLYVLDHANVGHELILACEVAPGKLKRIRFNSDFGQAEFGALVDALVQLKPEIDIRTLPIGEAHKKMGATNFVALAPVIAMLAVTGLVAVLFVPAFIHGLDSGSQTVDVKDCLGECELQTRNLIVRGVVLGDESIQKETTTEGSSAKTIEYFFPLVSEDWKPGEPVHWVIKTPELTDAEAEKIDPAAGIQVVLRDVWWEGLDSDAEDYFKNEIKLVLAEDLRMVEYQADTALEAGIGLGVVGFTLLVMAIIAIVTYVKNRKRASA